MPSSGNTTEFCNITQASHEKWKEAYQNSTFKPQFTAGDNGTSSTSHQQCTADGKYSGDGAVHCPTTIFPKCQLMGTENNSTSYPFSVHNNTTEECQCIGFFPNVTSTSTLLNCTCMNDWNANNTTSLLNHTTPYLLTKNCTAELVQNNTIFNMSCTFLDCRFNAQAQALNITLNPSESCNDTSPVTFMPNITDVTTVPTTQPATSPAANTSSVPTSAAPTSKNISAAPSTTPSLTSAVPPSSPASNTSSSDNSSTVAPSLTSLSIRTPTSSEEDSSSVSKSATTTSLTATTIEPTATSNTTSLLSSTVGATTNMSTFSPSGQAELDTSAIIPHAQASSSGCISPLNNNHIMVNPMFFFLLLLFHLLMYYRSFRKENLHTKKKDN